MVNKVLEMKKVVNYNDLIKINCQRTLIPNEFKGLVKWSAS